MRQAGGTCDPRKCCFQKSGRLAPEKGSLVQEEILGGASFRSRGGITPFENMTTHPNMDQLSILQIRTTPNEVSFPRERKDFWEGIWFSVFFTNTDSYEDVSKHDRVVMLGSLQTFLEFRLSRTSQEFSIRPFLDTSRTSFVCVTVRENETASRCSTRRAAPAPSILPRDRFVNTAISMTT